MALIIDKVKVAQLIKLTAVSRGVPEFKIRQELRKSMKVSRQLFSLYLNGKIACKGLSHAVGIVDYFGFGKDVRSILKKSK